MATTLVSTGVQFPDNRIQTTNAPHAKASFTDTGSGTSINSSVNISSITRNGNADYTVNFTSALPNAFYTACGAARNIAGNVSAFIITYQDTGFTKTTTACRIAVPNDGGVFDNRLATSNPRREITVAFL